MENMLKQQRQTRDEAGLVYFTTHNTPDFKSENPSNLGLDPLLVA